MSALAIGSGTRRWLRIAKIVTLFVVVGPFIASVLVLAGHFVEGLSNSRYALSLANWAEAWAGWLGVGYMVVGPYALVVSVVFATLAVFLGWRSLWAAVAIALAPLLVVHMIPAVGNPIWRWPPFLSASAIGLAVVTTVLCWYLSRRWIDA